MATSTFDVDDAKVIQSGRFEYALLTSQRALVINGTNSALDFTVTGTDAAILLAVSATGTNYLQVQIDGGSFTNLTMPGSTNTYTSTTLFTGLSDAAHTVRIKHVTGTTTNVYIQVVAGLSVTGAAPALAAPSSSLFGNVYRADWGELLNYAVPEGVVTSSTSGGYARYALMGPDSQIRFSGNPTSIQVFASNNGSEWRVTQDGVAIGSKTTLANDSTYSWSTLATGLSGTHDYTITNVTSISRTVAYIVQVNLIGGDLDKSAPVLARRPAIAFVGDSITAGNGTSDSSINWPSLVANSKGYQSINYGFSGQKTLSTQATAISTENSNPVFTSPTQYRDQVKYVVTCIGHNDSALTPLGSGSSEYRAALVRLLRRLKLQYPGATHYILSPPDTTAYSTTVRDNLAADCSAAATTVGGVTYIRICSSAAAANYTDGAFTGSGDMTDGTHPNATGASKIAAFIASNFATAPALGGTIPSAADVRSGTAVGSTTGTLAVPAAGNVLLGVAVDAGTGTATLPSAALVLSGVTYGVAGTGSTGTYVVVATGNVRSGTTFGAAAALTGTLAVPSVANVLNGVSVDATTGIYVAPTASDVKVGVTFGPASGSTGTYDGSDRWTDPGVANVIASTAYKAGSTSNNRTGTYVAAATGNVKIGVTFGDGSGQTGTYDGSDRWTDPGEANVATGVQYKANSATNNKTGTLNTGGGPPDYPSQSDVRSGVAYADDSLTGNLILPAESDVRALVNYGAGGTEYTGTLNPGGSYPTADQIAAAVVATAEFVAVKAAVYDSASVSGNTATLANGATQVVSGAGRVTTGP